MKTETNKITLGSLVRVKRSNQSGVVIGMKQGFWRVKLPNHCEQLCSTKELELNDLNIK